MDRAWLLQSNQQPATRLFGQPPPSDASLHGTPVEKQHPAAYSSRPTSERSDFTEDAVPPPFSARSSAARSLSAFLGERIRWELSTRLCSSSAAIIATLLPLRRRIRTISRFSVTSSQRLAKLALASV